MQKKVILAEKKDMAIRFAAALGGIKLNNKYIVKLSDLDKPNILSNCLSKASNEGFIRTVFGDIEYYIVWSDGHICTLLDMKDVDSKFRNFNNIKEFVDFSIDKNKQPITPGSNLKIIPGKEKLFENIKNFFTNDYYEEIISATDFGREGELIFRYIYDLIKFQLKESNSNKKILPYRRAKIVELTEEGIRLGIKSLENNYETYSREVAAYARAYADKILGDNLTVEMNRKPNPYGKTLKIGRIKTPVLFMIVHRSEEIKNFIPKTHYLIQAEFTLPNGRKYIGTLRTPDFKKNYNIEDLNVAKQVLNSIIQKNSSFKVQKIKQETINIAPPPLYDTSSLLIDAGKTFNIDANQTSCILQILYENGYITYPRTDSNYLLENMRNDIYNRATNIVSNIGYMKKTLSNTPLVFNDTIFNNSKVQDHFAIIPTTKFLSKKELANLNISSLYNRGTSSEQIFEKIYYIYMLICYRLIENCLPDMVQQKDIILTGDDFLPFKTFKTTTIQSGWAMLRKKPKVTSSITKNLSLGDTVIPRFFIHNIMSTKPSYYTDGSLIEAMQRVGQKMKNKEYKDVLKNIKGLGTAATRVSVINQLLTDGYIIRDKKVLKPTELGKYLIGRLPIEELKNPSLTAQWELLLKEMESPIISDNNAIVLKSNEKTSSEYIAFLDTVRTSTQSWCKKINGEIFL